jgi:hypothetical protein
VVSDSEKKTDRPCSTSLETLLRDATSAQRSEIERAASEAPRNVERIAQHILNDHTVRIPIAALLTQLRRGAHLTQKARTVGSITSTDEDWQRWDPALAEASAEHAQELLARSGIPLPAWLLERKPS